MPQITLDPVESLGSDSMEGRYVVAILLKTQYDKDECSNVLSVKSSMHLQVLF